MASFEGSAFERLQLGVDGVEIVVFVVDVIVVVVVVEVVVFVVTVVVVVVQTAEGRHEGGRGATGRHEDVVIVVTRKMKAARLTDKIRQREKHECQD